MPKIAKTLSALQTNRLKIPGWHAVGGVPGLLLQIRPAQGDRDSFNRSWILRTLVGSKRQVLGLGTFPQVSLSEARELAKKLTQDARKGIDLKAQKKSAKSTLLASTAKNKTFRECAESYIEAHKHDYTNDKHQKQWVSTLKTYAYPIIGNILVADIAVRDILDALEQTTKTRNGNTGRFWYVKNETAKRLLGRIKTVLDYATVNEYRTGNNPATWTGFLDTQLPSPKSIRDRKKHPSLPYSQVGNFISLLKKNKSISAKALHFLILTAVRSGSVRKAEWFEIDFNKKIWIIPPHHTKNRQEHRVPLAPQAIELLKLIPKIEGNPKIFPSSRGKFLSDMALLELMRGMRERKELNIPAVPHGFRSTFRVWAAEQTSYPDEIRKAASGHSIGDAVKETYQRTDLLEKRRELMNDWAYYIEGNFNA